ncbi:MAG: D-glycero-beta-D-manno-heptose-7-phosphate kinase, partial [Acidobacteriota bacterium]|nr:D-glycero-beta-D-manno-heptose-7-phosphate kinase [Acidobacteriota bacterium]
MFEKKFIENFSALNVLIVGDVMLDRYWWGSVSRISPEAPVPVVNLEKVSLAAGGAANVAANIAGLGAKPYLVGVIGEDAEADLFPAVLNDKNISADFLLKSKRRGTTVKTRVVAHSQQIVRVDQETKTDLDEGEESALWEIISGLLATAQIVIISDYGKGVITENIASRLITTAKRADKMVIVDPKGKNYRKYSGATILTPNRYEAAEVHPMPDFEQAAIAAAGRQIIADFDLEALLITQGEAGMTLFERDEAARHLSVTARKVYDVTGAGDTVIACLAAAVGSGASFAEAAKFANIAAG